jgi:hypothetical protein
MIQRDPLGEAITPPQIGELGTLIEVEKRLELQLSAAREEAGRLLAAARSKVTQAERALEAEIEEGYRRLGSEVEAERRRRAEATAGEARRQAGLFDGVSPERLESLARFVVDRVVRPSGP